jgi:hypothetical protein
LNSNSNSSGFRPVPDRTRLKPVSDLAGSVRSVGIKNPGHDWGGKLWFSRGSLIREKISNHFKV